MDLFKSAVILLYFAFLRLSVYSQAGDSIDFNNYIPSGCIREPVLTIGLITDPQYCDCDPEENRYYRETLWKLPQAIDTMNKYQVDFVMNLGDMIDRYYESYDSVSKHYDSLNMPYYNLLGNHEFEEVADELKSSIVSRYGMPDYYYAFDYGDWRFLVLDGTELAGYTRYIHPGLAEEGDSVWNSVQGEINGLSWNGGISKVQQAWIRSEIEDAADSGQNVILFCHFPVYPDSVDLNLWNKDEMMALMEQYSNVVAYINGHFHDGNFGYRNNIYYYTQPAMLDTPDSSAFAIMRVYPEEIVIQGFGRVPDRTMPYDNCKKKTLQIFLSDTLLHYSSHKDDLVGFLTYLSDDTAMLVNYVLDSARYHNRYFRIGHDSLILNTTEDLSLIKDLKISVITVDCVADTFSQTFDLLFDTTVMKFSYALPDTILSVSDDYAISVDSLIRDYSKSGLYISLNATTTGIVTCYVTDDTVKVIPAGIGNTGIILAAFDPFTGKAYQESFSMEIYDPLNHAPYHTDTLITDYVVQLSDTARILLTEIFIDPDGDIPDYFFTIHDTDVAAGVLQNDHLLVAGLQSGKTDLSVTANDNRGGIDSVTFFFRVNTAPFHPDTITVNYNIRVNDRFSLYLLHLFQDADDDTLSFDCVLSGSAELDIMLVNDSLKMLGLTAGIAGLTVTADDHYGGTDTVEIIVLIEESPDLINENVTTVNDLRIFPNPSSGYLYIQFRSIKDVPVGILILDQKGRLIYQSVNLKANQGNNHYILNAEHMKTKGLYFIMLQADEEQLISKSILLE